MNAQEIKIRDEVGELIKKKQAKQNEIDKRREILNTYIESDTNKEKSNSKVEKIYSKLVDLSGSTVNTINYYKEQISNAENIYQREINKLELKKQEAIRKAEAIYEINIKILDDKKEEAIRKAESVYDINSQLLQDKKNSNILQYENNIMKTSEKLFDKSTSLVEQTNTIITPKTIDEDGDKLLIKLKVELKQIQEQLDDKNKFLDKLSLDTLRYQNNVMEEKKREYRQLELDAENKKREKAEAEKVELAIAEKKRKDNLAILKEKNPEEFMSKEELREISKSRNRKIKEFKSQYSDIINSYTFIDKYNVKEPIVEEFMRKDIDDMINLTTPEEVSKFFDSKKDFYIKKITFENSTLNKLSDQHQKIYTNLILLTKDNDIYDEFFELSNIDKQKKYLNHYKKEYEFHLEEDK